MHNNKLDDPVLWNMIRGGDSKAFNTLFDRYWSIVFTTAFYYIKDKEVCNNITHDIFLNIWVKRDVLEIESFKAYLTTAARYHVYKQNKSAKVIRLTYLENPEKLESGFCRNSADEKLSYLELEKKVNVYLKQLPQRCQEIFVLSRRENFSNDEIATKFGISKRTVENQLTSALKHFRISLKSLAFIIVLISRLV